MLYKYIFFIEFIYLASLSVRTGGNENLLYPLEEAKFDNLLLPGKAKKQSFSSISYFVFAMSEMKLANVFLNRISLASRYSVIHAHLHEGHALLIPRTGPNIS